MWREIGKCQRRYSFPLQVLHICIAHKHTLRRHPSSGENRSKLFTEGIVACSCFILYCSPYCDAVCCSFFLRIFCLRWLWAFRGKALNGVSPSLLACEPLLLCLCTSLGWRAWKLLHVATWQHLCRRRGTSHPNNFFVDNDVG